MKKLLCSLAVAGGQAQRDQIRLQAHHDRLGFRVAEAAVVLDHLRRAVGHARVGGVDEPIHHGEPQVRVLALQRLV